MSRFIYKVRDHKGELSTGVVQAVSADEAGQVLRSQGKFIVRLDPIQHDPAASSTGGKPSAGTKIKRSEVAVFANQMAVMIETGVPVSEALDCIVDQCQNESFKAVLSDVTEKVQAGTELSRALGEYPRVFPTIMTSLIRAAEVSGQLGPMLQRISIYIEKEQKTIRKVRGAVTYPMVMLALVLTVTVFLLTFVLPRFAGIYETRGAALPTPTRLLIGMSNTMMDHWQSILASLCVAAVAGYLFVQSSAGRKLIDFVKLNTPLIGPLFRGLYLTRACRTMGTMINAGVPILEMVSIVRHVTDNSYYQELWDDVDESLKQGAQLSAPMFDSTLVPRSVAQMIYSGEKAGRVGQVMEKVAQFSEDEFDESVRQTTQYIEPMLVITMGLIIGFVAIALLLPIFNVSTVVSGG